MAEASKAGFFVFPCTHHEGLLADTSVERDGVIPETHIRFDGTVLDFDVPLGSKSGISIFSSEMPLYHLP